ncbi:hypothetical protein [Modestobacter sp. NPDC049651]|uniref:hypothetical protein n=1 Tax=unclassified Modestobacter TaxID=2643866 RepID=UPI0033E47EFC
MAVIENISYFLIVDRASGRVVGYAAYGTAEFSLRRRRGLKVQRENLVKLMSNVYVIAEGGASGFGICDEEEVESYRQGVIRYRGITYRLQKAPAEMVDELWDEYLGESFD